MEFLHKDLDNDDRISCVTTEFMPSHFVFRIESFSLLSENCIDKYECTEFKAGGYKWRLVVCPTEGDDVSVYLSVSDPKSLDLSWEVNAMFGIFLHNHIENNFLCKRKLVPCRFNAISPCWGFAKFISKKILNTPSNGYLVNDTCVFGADVFVSVKPVTLERLSLLTKAAKPYVRSWTISKFAKIKDHWKSETFTAADQSWYVCLNPGGSGEAKGRSISISLYLNPEKNQPRRQKVKADFTIRIKDQTGDKHRELSTEGKWFDTPSWACGWSSFISNADMKDPRKGFLVKDRCVLEAEINVLAVARCSP